MFYTIKKWQQNDYLMLNIKNFKYYVSSSPDKKERNPAQQFYRFNVKKKC